MKYQLSRILAGTTLTLGWLIVTSSLELVQAGPNNGKEKPKIVFTMTILAQVGETQKPITVEADEYFVNLVAGGKYPELTTAYFANLAKGVLESHRMRGITLVGLK